MVKSCSASLLSLMKSGSKVLPSCRKLDPTRFIGVGLASSVSHTNHEICYICVMKESERERERERERGVFIRWNGIVEYWWNTGIVEWPRPHSTRMTTFTYLLATLTAKVVPIIAMSPRLLLLWNKLAILPIPHKMPNPPSTEPHLVLTVPNTWTTKLIRDSALSSMTWVL